MGAAAAAAAGDRRGLGVLLGKGLEGERPKETLEDFAAPLLLPELPPQLVASLLRFFVCLTAAAAPAAAAMPGAEAAEWQLPAEAGKTSTFWGSSKVRQPSPAALRARLLLQHSPSFATAVVFLLMTRVTPQDGLDRQQHGHYQVRGDNQQEQQPFKWASALYDLLLLLHAVFLSDLRSAYKLKVNAEALHSALSDWEAALQQLLQKQGQEQQERPHGKGTHPPPASQHQLLQQQLRPLLARVSSALAALI